MLVKQAIRAIAILLKKVIENKAFFACLGGFFCHLFGFVVVFVLFSFFLMMNAFDYSSKSKIHS